MLISFDWNIRTHLKVLFSWIAHHLGLLEVLKRKDPSIIFLTYHDISERDYLHIQIPPALFKRQIRYLKENYEIISIYQAIERLSTGDIDKPYVVITFDDCYKSFFEVVFPTLSQMKAPFTLFLQTSPLEDGIPPFVDAVAFALNSTRARHLDLTDYGLKNFFIGNRTSKLEALKIVNETSKIMLPKKRREFLLHIFDRLSVDIEDPSLKELILKDDELKEMSTCSYVTIGSHSHFHSYFQHDMDPCILYEELERSIHYLESRLGTKIDLFALPYGGYNGRMSEVVNYLKELKIRGVCTLGGGIRKHNDVWILGRKCITMPHVRYLPENMLMSSFIYDLRNAILREN